MQVNKMRRKYLGDSYDALKRMWQELLADLAPLYANSIFIPSDLRQDFTNLTRIPMLPDNPPMNYSILNDPDTGIRLPGKKNQTEGRKHISIRTIVNQLANSGAQCVITYDQSNYRNIGMKLDEQRRVKMSSIISEGFHCFYYVSHAPFMFAVPNKDALGKIQNILKIAGIPKRRFEKHQ